MQGRGLSLRRQSLHSAGFISTLVLTTPAALAQCTHTRMQVMVADADVLAAVFRPHGELDSVRVFAHKTFAFVNYQRAEHAAAAKAALEMQARGRCCLYVARRAPKNAAPQRTDLTVALPSSPIANKHHIQRITHAGHPRADVGGAAAHPLPDAARGLRAARAAAVRRAGRGPRGAARCRRPAAGQQRRRRRGAAAGAAAAAARHAQVLGAEGCS